jgi:polysaccharide export outer membrane protein
VSCFSFRFSWRAWHIHARAIVATFAVLAGACRPNTGEAALAASLGASGARAAERAATVPVAVGDRVRIHAWREPQYSDDQLVVDHAGQVTLPRVGAVRAAGLTVVALRDSVQSRYAEFLRNPVITVTVLRRVGLQGEVRAPGLYFVDPTTSLRDVITQGGGLTEAANASRVSLVRDGKVVAGARRRAGRGKRVPVARPPVGRRDRGRSAEWLSRNALAVVSTMGLVVSVAVQVLRR